jgi:hypothetical protein
MTSNRGFIVLSRHAPTPPPRPTPAKEIDHLTFEHGEANHD